MRITLILTTFLSFMVCCGQEKSPNRNTESSKSTEEKIAKAVADAKKLEKEVMEKAKALEQEALDEVARKQVEKEQVREAESNLKEQNSALISIPNSALRKYNGFYLNDFNQEGALVFTDGTMFHFNCSRTKTIYKDEQYLVKNTTEHGYLDIVGQVYKNRHNEVYMKETVLKREILPEFTGQECTVLQRRGRNFIRIGSFRDFIKTRTYYPFEKFMADFKSNYKNRSDLEINDALDYSKFYLTDFFTESPFYGDGVPLTSVLESIITYRQKEVEDSSN